MNTLFLTFFHYNRLIPSSAVCLEQPPSFRTREHQRPPYVPSAPRFPSLSTHVAPHFWKQQSSRFIIALPIVDTAPTLSTPSLPHSQEKWRKKKKKKKKGYIHVPLAIINTPGEGTTTATTLLPPPTHTPPLHITAITAPTKNPSFPSPSKPKNPHASPSHQALHPSQSQSLSTSPSPNPTHDFWNPQAQTVASPGNYRASRQRSRRVSRERTYE